jgi:class 3 adenylate cyclase
MAKMRLQQRSQEKDKNKVQPERNPLISSTSIREIRDKMDPANASEDSVEKEQNISGQKFQTIAVQPHQIESIAPEGHSGEANESGPPLSRRSSTIQEDVNDIEIPEESKVGKRLSELTTRRVVILILLMLFCLPLFEIVTFLDQYQSHEYGLQAIIDMYDNTYTLDTPSYYEDSITEYIVQHENDDTYPLIYLQCPFYQIFEVKNRDDLRYSEYTNVGLQNADDLDFVSTYETRHDAVILAWLSLGRTLFVCLVLNIGSILFSIDSNKLVLNPLERMLEKVNAIAKNPIEASEGNMEDVGVYNLMKKTEGDVKKEETSNYETEVLENTIIKIGRLLALGFGEAGSKIIGENMSGTQGEVNPMMAGVKCIAIFGFCDIRNFTDATEVLETKVLLFVNQIADIVHSCVHRYNGSANKNIGDAFLLVWKFEPICTKDEGNTIVLRKTLPQTKMQADLALLSFLKIIAKLNKHPDILQYRTHRELQARMTDYSVKMGFGLHQGWAIEGAIGSFYKIDASYLSPNVNIAARLEAATKQYGVPVLMSGEFASLLSPKIKEKCREIDCVTVKGSLQPLHLFTMDVDPTSLKESADKYRNLTGKEKKKLRMSLRKSLLNKIAKGKITTTYLFERDKDIEKMRKKINSRFFNTFEEGYKNYIEGNWEEAEVNFHTALAQKPKDGPSITLLEFMEGKSHTVPGDWVGVRELTEK